MADNPMVGILTRVEKDADFRKRLLSDPRATLRGAGVNVPDSMEVRVVEDTGSRRTLVLPPAAGELSEAELDAVAGAGWGDPSY